MNAALAVSVVVLALGLVLTWVALVRHYAELTRVAGETAACARSVRQLADVVAAIPGAPAVMLDPALPLDSAMVAPPGTEPVVIARARPWRVIERT